MGSLSSRPKIPSQPQQIMFVPQPQATTTPQAISTTTDQSIGTALENNEETAALPENESQARSQSLLRRGRGRFGTVQTSFRGLLGLSDSDSSGRKTLLGE
ncbi:MAG: hypothetical protein KAJ86_08160 [Alphaproteobacteria bacterium]|nr:hypothetical protein [Alphaproteobacteria bacterium]